MMRALVLRPSVLSFLVLGLASTAVGQASWQLAYPPLSPPPDWQWNAAFDEFHGEALIHTMNQAWRWNGATWAQLGGPMPNLGSANMVYDVARQRVVLWGGGAGAVQQHWEWDGSTWQQRLVTMPPSRNAAASAYDRARGVTVMFGGHNGNAYLDDTWEWNGVAWSNANPAVRPSARNEAAMAFDPSTQRVLLYGGLGAGQLSNIETWSWNGSAWQQHTPTTPPYGRLRATMVADLDRARVVLHGGSDFDTQTWQWDGSQWHPSTPGSPGVLFYPASFYDTVRREVVLQGGNNNLGMTNYTWRYRTDNAATAVSFGSGCAGAIGVPVLANVPYHLPWLGDTMQNRVNVAPVEIGAVFVSSFAMNPVPVSLAAVGMPGCDLLLPLDLVEFRAALSGFATWSLPIPNNPSLVGVPIHQQAFPFDAAANALGLVASNGLMLTPGIR